MEDVMSSSKAAVVAGSGDPATTAGSATTVVAGSPDPATDIPLGEIESELARQLGEGRPETHTPMLRARLSNLVIYCNKPEQAEAIGQVVPEIVSVHPARVLLLLAEPGSEAPLRAYLNVW